MNRMWTYNGLSFRFRVLQILGCDFNCSFAAYLKPRRDVFCAIGFFAERLIWYDRALCKDTLLGSGLSYVMLRLDLGCGWIWHNQGNRI